MVDSLRFTADDDDDFGYEEEQIDVTTEVGEYGPEDEDDDDLTKPVPRAGSHHSPCGPNSPVSGRRGAAAKETRQEGHSQICSGSGQAGSCACQEGQSGCPEESEKIREKSRGEKSRSEEGSGQGGEESLS